MFKNMDRWIGSYLKQALRGSRLSGVASKPVHIMLAVCDHYEPDWGGAAPELQIERVQRWVDGYPQLADAHRDSEGQHPKHSFFYPAEVYNAEHCDLLAQLCDRGYGEVEIHLHHDGDTEESLRAKLEQAKVDFDRHGFLSRRVLSGQLRFAFIHGNWSLNNSRRDGKWCGVNNESRVLADAGCYADFTYPSAPSETQPSKINSIYYSSSSRQHPKSHNKGKDVRVGVAGKADLMLIQGPLTLNWSKRSRGIFPRIENGDLTGANPPTEDRVDLWVRQHVHVQGRPDWCFIKLHTHGAPEKNAYTLLGDSMHRMYNYLEQAYNDGQRYCLHYVTAREMYNIIKAAEAGEQGNPGEYRDYLLMRNERMT